MPSPIFFSRPSFSLDSIVRGAQLTVVGVNRVLLNPELAKYGFYKKAGIAFLASILLQLILWAPLIIIKWIGLVVLRIRPIGSHEGLYQLISIIDFVQNNVLNVGHLMIGLTRFLRSDLEDLFLLSLAWVDHTYVQKHPEATHDYYKRLMTYKPMTIPGSHKKGPSDLIHKYIRWCTTMLALYVASLIPVVGWVVFPLMSCYEMSTLVSTQSVLPLFILGLVVPKKWTALFVGTFWGSRNLVSELLEPYFRRIPLAEAQRKRWYLARSGILFGFGAGFYLLMKIPFMGLFIYGLAQASAAYLITKISDPPPSPDQLERWTESQLLFQFDWGTKNK